MKQQVVDIILISLIFILIITIVVLVIKFDKDGFECMVNPISYYEHMKEVSCDCQTRNEWNNFKGLNLSLP